MKKILIVSQVPTHPPVAGNRSCILSYSSMLQSLGYPVYYLWIAGFYHSDEEEILMREFWKNHLYIFKKTLIHRVIEFFFRLLHFKRTGFYKIDDYYPYGIKKLIKEIQKKEKFDIIISNYIFLSKIFNYLHSIKKILYTHDVFTNKYQHTGQKWFSVTANEEAKALNRADTILAIQENEAIFYSYLTEKKVFTTYSYFSIVETPFIGKQVLLYLAGSNSYNIEAIQFFIESVFMPLLNTNPKIILLIGGKICNEIKNICKVDNIKIFGEVNNLIDFYSQGDIFINPTFKGTGLKIKTFEAMSFGKIIIGHPHTKIGIFKPDIAPILLAQNFKEYTIHFDSLFNDEERILDLKKKSTEYIKELNTFVSMQFVDAIEN